MKKLVFPIRVCPKVFYSLLLISLRDLNIIDKCVIVRVIHFYSACFVLQDHSSRERSDPGSTSLLGCEDLKRVGGEGGVVRGGQ